MSTRRTDADSAAATTARCAASARPKRASASSPRAPSCCTASRSGTGGRSRCAASPTRAGVNERTVYRHFANERELRDAVMARLEERSRRRARRARARRHPRTTPRGSSSTCRRSRSSRARRDDPTLRDAHRRQRDALHRGGRGDDRRLVRTRPRRRGRRCSTCCGASRRTNGSSSTGASTRTTRSTASRGSSGSSKLPSAMIGGPSIRVRNAGTGRGRGR